MKADLDVTLDLARALLREQHPDLAGLPLRVAANGWDNVMVRAGSHLVLRLPRRAVAAPLLAHELATVPHLAAHIGAAVPEVNLPVPLRAGTPSESLGYPWPWSVLRWVDGVRAADTPVAARRAWAPTFGRFLAALHQPVTDGVPAPVNPLRGIPLSARVPPPVADLAAHSIARNLAAGSPQTALHRIWDDALDAPEHTGPPVWIHGDPHPANLVVTPGGETGGEPVAGAGGVDRLTAVVDFGDVTAGDPASDLGTLWLTFDAVGRAACRAAMAAAGTTWDDATWRRARGWALAYCAAMLAHPDDHPGLVPIGEHGLAALLTDALLTVAGANNVKPSDVWPRDAESDVSGGDALGGPPTSRRRRTAAPTPRS